jgi:hypothetical protein
MVYKYKFSMFSPAFLFSLAGCAESNDLKTVPTAPDPHLQLRRAKLLDGDDPDVAIPHDDAAATPTPDAVQLAEASLLKQLSDLTTLRKELIRRRDKRQLTEDGFRAQMAKVEIEAGRLQGALRVLREGTRPPRPTGPLGSVIGARGAKRRRWRGMRIVIGTGLLATVAIAATAFVYQFVLKPRSQERSDRLPSALEHARR